MSHKLAVISVVYQNYIILKDFFNSFNEQSNKDFKLFLTDLSINKKPIETTLPITLLEGDNLGYAYGINLGLKEAIKQGCDKFCIINNDTYVDKDFISNVLNSILHHPSSILGGKVYYAPGYEYHKQRYKKSDPGKIIWYAGGKVDWKNAFTEHLSVDEVDKGQFNQFKETDFITGCFMCFDKRVIEKLGFLDEGYFLYYEDADYCERAKRKGIKLYYDPKIVIWHKNAGSTEGSGSKIHQRYQERNRLRFGLKYAPWRTKLHLIKNKIHSHFMK